MTKSIFIFSSFCATIFKVLFPTVYHPNSKCFTGWKISDGSHLSRSVCWCISFIQRGAACSYLQPMKLTCSVLNPNFSLPHKPPWPWPYLLPLRGAGVLSLGSHGPHIPISPTVWPQPLPAFLSRWCTCQSWMQTQPHETCLKIPMGSCHLFSALKFTS